MPRPSSITNDQIDTAYVEGQTARRSGYGKDTCPYARYEKRTLYFWWLAGWNDEDTLIAARHKSIEERPQ